MPSPPDVVGTLVLCAAVGGLGFAMHDTALAVLLYGLSPIAAIEDPSWAGAVGGLAALLFAELFFRGVVFDGLAPLAGRTNAAIGVAIISAVLYIHPFMMLLAAVASAIRLRTDSIWPGYVLGVSGLAGLALGLA